MNAPTLQRLVFGLTVPESAPDFDSGVGSLIRWVGTRAGLDLVRFQVPSYEALARQMTEGALQLAWLPPIIFVRLERDGIASAMVQNRRGSVRGYQSVLLVRASSRIHNLEGLRGATAAWVDPLSASGYVLPRIQLAAQGIDPRTIFSREKFCGSHGAAVRAVLDGSSDVAATFAVLDANGGVTPSTWREHAEVPTEVRVLATFGEIPSDVIAVRNDVPHDFRVALVSALAAACRDDAMRPIVKRVFGAETFSTGDSSHYDGLRSALDAAEENGLLDVASVNSTRNTVRPV